MNNQSTVKVKTIIVDLDRTLLRTDKTISPYTAAVLRKCNQYGIKIMVATARPWRDTKPYLETVDFDAMVVSNGSRVICGNLKRNTVFVKRVQSRYWDI